MPFQKGHKSVNLTPTKSGQLTNLDDRLSARRSRTSEVSVARTPTRSRLRDEPEDEEMEDGDAQGDGDEDGIRFDEEVEEEEAATPAQDDEDEDEDAPPTITTLPSRRRGRGRGGRGAGRRSTRAERIDYGTPLPPDADGDEGSESGTPFKRRRGRPEGSGRARGRGGFRGRRKGQQPDTPRVVVDKDGQALDVADDEVQVDDDATGNTKVDEKGNLLGGREYRVRTFKIMGKEERLYMLSTEPARCCGFRDSYLFFTKHPKLFKVLIDEEQKKDLIDRDILPSSYKGRNIGVVTARSVFREFGARIIVGGRKVTDDYKEAEARANGELEGELADPEDRIPDNKEDYNRNRYVAWFGASEVYRNTGQGTVPTGKHGPIGKRRNNITVTNWQFMHAREASRFNSNLTAMRRMNLDGVYDTQMNMMYYPQIMQPTHARWEQIPQPDAILEQKPLSNGLANGHANTNGSIDHEDDHDVMDVEEIPRSQESSQPTIFYDLPPIISRNFGVIDTHYTAPPISNAGYPGPDGHILDSTSGTNGLSGISDDIADELPEDCRLAFEEAKHTELQWKKQWSTEAHSGLRGGLKIGLTGYPV